MFSLLPRLAATAAVRAPLRTNAGLQVYEHSPVSRTFFSAPVLADPAAKTAVSSEEKTPAKKRGRKPKAEKAAPTPKPKKVKKVPPPAKPKFSLSMMPPRRPSPPYILFATEYLSKQSEIKVSMSGHDVTREDVKALLSARGKAAGAAWKELPEFEKQKYSAEHAKLKEQYQTDLAAWQQSVDPETLKLINAHRRRTNQRRIVVPTQGPKRPLTSFFRFSQDKRDEVKAELSPAENLDVVKELGRRWNNMSDAEKQPYITKSEEAREAYRKAKEEHDASTV